MTAGVLVAVESTWVARYRYARVLLDQRTLVERGSRVDDVEFGQMVAERMEPARDTPFSKASVSQWGSAKQAPPTPVRRAIALVCGVDPGWLDHGPASAAPSPPGWREPAERAPAPTKKRRR